MKIVFQEHSKHKSDEYIASFEPIETTSVLKDAFMTDINIYTYTDGDFKAAIIKPIEKIISETEALDVSCLVYDDTVSSDEDSADMSEKHIIAEIHIDERATSASVESDKADPETSDAIKSMASDLSMYSYDLMSSLVMKSIPKTVSEMVGKLKSLDTAEDFHAKDSSEDAINKLISEIQQRTKADIVKPKETLADYVCSSSLKAELYEIKDFFEREAIYKDKGITIPKGILFKGVPGTGKTYAARCIAGDVNCYFMVCTASSLQGQYIGSGAQNVKDVFKGAKALREASGKGVIVFIDELDSFGSRESHSGSSSGEEDRTLNQLLAELSGFEDCDGIMVMGATNYPERIDEALTRSGRFSRQITIQKPDDDERIYLVEYYFNKIKMPIEDTNFVEIASRAKGLTPADIKEIANESAILAMRTSKDKIYLEDINEAINKVITKNIRTPDGKLDLKRVAAHEAGHVLADFIYNHNIAIKVTNYSYGGAGGFTQPPENLEGLFTKERLLNEIKVLVAGRVAEKVFCIDFSNGASNDLEKAKALLKTYYTKYYFEAFNTKEIDQIIQDKIFEIIEIVEKDFEKEDSVEKLRILTKEIMLKRVLYTKDIAAIVYKGECGI